MMAGRVREEIYKLCVFTVMMIVCGGQNTHMRNIALNKRCDLSSRFVGKTNLISGNCSAAINGNTNTVLDLYSNPPNCIHTREDDPLPFWWVDLGQEVAISIITIYGRTDYIWRMECVNVYVDKNVVKRFVNGYGWPNNKYSITVNRGGQEVKITKDCKTWDSMNVCEVEVLVCDDGWYGPTCTQACGQCVGDSVCDKINGSCTSCQTGFQLPTCEVCTDGWYGVNCSQTCGNCANQSVCDKTTGSCTSCTTRFNPPLCKDCADGLYGVSCLQTCGNCDGNSVCDKTTGSCSSCKTGFYPPLCKECQFGWYGSNCNETCGHCEGGNTTCDKVSGRCPSCSGAFQPPLCKDKCNDGSYGENCGQTCGHCLNNTICDPDNGTCLAGCSIGFVGDPCHEPMTSGQPLPSNVLVGPIVGTVLSVIVAAVVVVIVMMLLRRRRQRREYQARLLRENKTIASSEQQIYPKPGNRNEASDPHVYGNLCENTSSSGQSTPATTSTRTDDHHENIFPENQKESTSALFLGGRNQRKDKALTTTSNSLATTERRENRRIYENVDVETNLPSHSHDIESKMVFTEPNKNNREPAISEDEQEESIYNTEDIYASYRSLEPSSILDEYQKSLLASLASGTLGMEFAEFRKDMHHPHEVGLQSENLNKNRFKALCAYDHSRVVLRRPKGDLNTDYINASYIKGCQRDKAYIATQGPRAHMVDDLWWMVWQENTTQIIMLTNLKEGGKDKCEEYWPSVGTTKTYGHVTVTAMKTDSRADFVVRYFVLESKQGGDERRVSQYHYLVWPDHGVPSTCSLVSFWRYVKARAQGAIPVVHCSAGVGRTGTYIGLDIASELRSRNYHVTVKDIVSRLREDRTLMVQTEEQYKFLHEVILEEHTSRATRMTFDQFDLVFPDRIDGHKSRIDKEFQVLKEMVLFVLKPRHTIAESKENVNKNRNTDSLPEDSHLVHLLDRVAGRNQYINAIQMSSFRKRQGLILTQLPLPDTVVDMWRLVDGLDIKTIVSLGHKNQSKFVKNYCSYWPNAKKDELKTGQHTVNLTSTSAPGDHITCFNLSLATQRATPREVRVLYYDDWADVVPGSISDILQLIDILESWDVEEDASPVVVQCTDGVSRSGMFCVLYDIINRAMHDQEIDVYLPVRHVQSFRPHAITTEDEYRYCYQAAQEYKRQHSVYQNT